MLTRNQKKYLTGICHHLKPVVMLGQKGLTENVMAEIDQALEAHELIKVKLRGGREDRNRWAGEIAERCNAELVQKIGMTACFFRRNEEKPQIELPR